MNTDRLSRIVVRTWFQQRIAVAVTSIACATANVQSGHLPATIKSLYASGMFDRLQLLVLTHVARTGSYSAAARSLGYTQPAVSYQMRRLEHAATTPLVIRAGRGIHLTNAGRRLAAHAETVLAALNAAEQEIIALSSQERGLVRLAAFQSACAAIVAHLPAVLAESPANVQLAIHQLEPPEAAEQITSGTVDIGLLCDWDNEPVAYGEQPFSRHLLLMDRRCVLFPLTHPLARATGEVNFADLRDESWVMETARDRFAAACAAAGFQPRIAGTVDDNITIQSMVAGGAGIALVNELGLLPYLDRRLAARPLADWPRRRVYASTWPQMGRVPAIATVLEALLQAARRVSTQLTRYQRRPRSPRAAIDSATGEPPPGIG